MMINTTEPTTAPIIAPKFEDYGGGGVVVEHFRLVTVLLRH